MPTFVCAFCKFTADSLSLHLEHRRKHTVRHADKYHCGYDGCKYNFNRETSLRSHLIRNHGLEVSVEKRKTLHAAVQDCGGKLQCPVSLCGKEFGRYADLSKHLAEHISSGTAVKCPVPDCPKVYKNVSSLRSHISRYHTSVITSEPAEPDQNEPYQFVEDNAKLGSCIVSPDLRSIFFINLSYLFLEMETKLLIPSSSIQKIAAQIFNLQEIHLEHVREVLGNFLVSKTDTGLVHEALDILRTNDLFLESKGSLSSTYKRHALYKKNLSYIPPVQVSFGQGSSKFFHYVSIKETVKSVIKSSSDLRKPQSEPFVLQDISDGTNIKDDPFLSQNNSLQLVLFQDAFEVANRARKKHKLLGIYFSIGNLPLHLRSQLDYIFLIALCKEVDFNSNRNFVHQKVVDELKEIERDGIQLESGEVICGSVSVICGDNLGSHGLAGLVENFSTSMYFCRYCLMSREDFESEGGEIRFYDRRTVQSYNDCVLQVADSNSDSVKGVKSDCVYNQLHYFHVCKPGLPPCLAHDLFEGIVSVDIALYLRYFVENKYWFSYKKLNALINNFPFTTDDQRDKPESVKSKPKKLDGKACQIWAFLRLLSLILLPKIKDKEDKVWLNLLRLQEIVDIVCSPVIHVSVLPYLELLILDYIHCRKTLFPRCPLKPKHHYVTHYPELIKVFGPLMNVWTLRFESKHGFFKSALTAGKNFKNVTKSASEKHQLYQAYMLGSRKNLGYLSMNGEMEFHSAMYMEEIRFELTKSGVCSNGFFDCTSVVFKGTTYCKGNLLAFEQKENEYSLKLGTIRVLISDGCERLFFIVQCVESDYDAGIRAYVLGGHRGYRCINVDELAHRQPVREYSICGRLYAKLKHAIVLNSIA